MRSRWLPVLAVVMLVAAAACSAPQVKEFGVADQQQIRQVVQDFVAAYNAADAAKVRDLYSGAAVLMPPNAATVRGSEPIQGYYHTRFNTDGATDLQVEPREVSGAGALGYANCTFSVNLKPEGGTERHDRGKILFVLRKLANRWLIEMSMWSSDLPPVVPEEPVKDEAAAKTKK